MTQKLSGAIDAWNDALAEGQGPRYLQIAGFIERAIADGRLQPGDRVPPQRQLAQRLGVDLTTVTRGFNEARQRHLLEARGPLGTFVAAPKAELAQRVDLSMNIPPPPAGVDLEQLLRRGMSQVLLRSDIDLLMTYHVGGGSEADRTTAAGWLRPMLGEVPRSRVVVSPGAQAALAALIVAMTMPGDTIACEPLVYPGLPLAASQLGRVARPIETDAHGMRPDALDAACREPAGTSGGGAGGIRLVYLNPTLQNPTATTMPAPRRQELLKVALRHRLRIVEDDPYWLFAPDAPPPLARIAPAQVAYLSTLSKCLSPGLRTAFVALPDEPSRDAFLIALRSFSLMSPPLTNSLVTQWINDGSAAQLLDGVRVEARERQRAAAQVLGAVAGDGAGIHLWYPLPSYWAPGELAAAAGAEGLAVAPSTAFHLGGQAPGAIRISLGATPDRTQLHAALRRLSVLLASDVSSGRGMIV
ncbi:PLP-dependent aminotransferase family protein [Burkholderia plantarii]|uniref:Putative transcriptional regulator, GntR family with aminotransferase domain n=1 Tax=Burkholderia plantarii TaxID=41899 RepID=A0A0B6S544_BURPL|nr:PLP-dependent aminotransferase family protein [Burkholderia plantarii]AJK48420.1 putative transcriptional regulator, GntR family with aminotransferase domain [Burkholderia plantarii]WLE61714.1 PLP-dependent aminotransferase family protein [Burkholderia plantarii]